MSLPDIGVLAILGMVLVPLALLALASEYRGKP
jgi:hypothetical protein